MLKIFGVPISVHTRKVIVTAKLKGIEYENQPVIPFDPPADWKALSPTGLIPAISDEGFALADSSAICAYLEGVKPGPSIYPDDARDNGRARWIEQYGGVVLFNQVVSPLFHEKIIRPHVLNEGQADDAKIADVVERTVPDVFGYLEHQIAGDFVVNGTMSIADITIASNLLNYQYLGFRLDAARYPKLTGTFARTIGQDAFRAALGDEEPFAAQMGLDRSFLN